MALYEYKCENCGEVFEVIQKFSEEPLTVHEKCGGKVEPLISAPSLVFKGSGFYITDYGKSGGAKHSDGGTPQKGESASKSGGSSEAGAASASTPSKDSSSSSSTSQAAPAASKSTSSDSK